MKRDFQFAMSQLVKLKTSSEFGQVIGRAEYLHSENCYNVRYMAGDGRQVEAWWGESALEAC